MERFTRHDSESNPEIARLYEEIVATGFGVESPINFFTALGGRPDILNAIWDLAKAVLVVGDLPGSVRQMIAMCISTQNACRYCAVVHRGALEASGVDPHVVEACTMDPEAANLTEPQRSIVQFALKAARDPAALTDDDFKQLDDQGLDQREITEVIMMAAFTNFINAWADISGIPLDSAA